jgi:hypothetical protein
MQKISKKSQKFLSFATLLFSFIFLSISYFIMTDTKISTHFNFEIWMEFSKSIILWYIVALLCAFGIDIFNKKQDKM